MYFLFDKCSNKIIANSASCYGVYDFIRKNFKRESFAVYPKGYLVPDICNDFETYTGYSHTTPPCRFVVLADNHNLIKTKDFYKVLFREEWPVSMGTKQPQNRNYMTAYGNKHHNPLKIKENAKFLISHGFYVRRPHTQNERALNALHSVDEWDVKIRGRRKKLPSSYDDKPISKFGMRKSWKYNSKRSKQWNPE